MTHGSMLEDQVINLAEYIEKRAREALNRATVECKFADTVDEMLSRSSTALKTRVMAEALSIFIKQSAGGVK